jgi:hypothetical protein
MDDVAIIIVVDYHGPTKHTFFIFCAGPTGGEQNVASL